MNNRVRLSQSCIDKEEKQAVCEVLDDGYLGMGRYVRIFEEKLEKFFSNKVHVACVNNGTFALLLSLQACGIKAGDRVLLPSITYVACFQAVSALGAYPVACDVDIKTGCMDIEDAARKIDHATKAVIYVHYAGGVGNRNALFNFARKFNLRVIEDAAHSFGGYFEHQRIGESGDIICFSFDGIKNITCGEGGTVVSTDHEVIEKIRDFRLLSVKGDTRNRYKGTRSWDFDVEKQGWRCHMSNINAAIGIEQLKKIDFFGEKRRKLVKNYHRRLGNLPVIFLNVDLENMVPHILPILVKSEKMRNYLVDFLLNYGIETGIHYKPNHLLTKFKGRDCPISEEFGKRVISLPLHVSLSDGDVEKVCAVITDGLKLGYS